MADQPCSILLTAETHLRLFSLLRPTFPLNPTNYNMEFRSNDVDSAASQPYYRTGQETPPTYELSKNDINPLQPPPPTYSTLTTEPYIGMRENTSNQGWESAPMRRSQREEYWSRIFKNGDDIWYQYGVSKRPTDDGPEFFFTCKMKPRMKGNERAIREVCRVAAFSMRTHRSHGSHADYHRCACNFKTWRDRGGSGGCRLSWYCLARRLIRYGVGYSMQRHDILCSCGCFDIGTGEEPTTSGH
jgi:hypothetical protein